MAATSWAVLALTSAAFFLSFGFDGCGKARGLDLGLLRCKFDLLLGFAEHGLGLGGDLFLISREFVFLGEKALLNRLANFLRDEDVANQSRAHGDFLAVQRFVKCLGDVGLKLLACFADHEIDRAPLRALRAAQALNLRLDDFVLDILDFSEAGDGLRSLRWK